MSTLAQSAQRLRVLHVEDDPSIRAITRVALETVGGFDLLSCDGGAAALRQAPGFDPQVLLLDVMMPGMDGPSTLRALSAQMPMGGRLVLFMTAKVQPADVEAYLALGAHEVIIKPFDAMRLHQDIRALWERFRDA